MTEIILQLPDDLARKLAPFRDRLPELLERGLRNLLADLDDETLAQERLSALATLSTIRQQIQDQKGHYTGDLLAETRLDREVYLAQNLDSAS